jgi:hypothetical protein
MSRLHYNNIWMFTLFSDATFSDTKQHYAVYYVVYNTIAVH